MKSNYPTRRIGESNLSLKLQPIFFQGTPLKNTTILFDNQQLVHLLNEVNLSNPPDWRIKPFTQIAANLLSGNSSQVRRIKRNQNQMADSLAKQALHALTTNHFVY